MILCHGNDSIIPLGEPDSLRRLRGGPRRLDHRMVFGVGRAKGGVMGGVLASGEEGAVVTVFSEGGRVDVSTG